MVDLFEVTGLAEVHRRVEELRALALPLAGIALQQEAEAILVASQPLVPVDTGELRASGAVMDVVIDQHTVSTGVRYGGPGTGQRRPEEYAIKVHEDVTLRHPRGGQHHFLSEPAFAATQGMLERLAEALRLAL